MADDPAPLMHIDWIRWFQAVKSAVEQPASGLAPEQITMTAPHLLGRTTAGTGGAEEISVSAPLTLSSLTLGISGSALTRVDDANVTLTLGGSPSSALLAATSLTLGWTGTLGVARGGTNIASYTVGDLLYASGATTLSKLADVAVGSVLVSGGVGVAPAWGSAAPVASTVTIADDTTTNATMYPTWVAASSGNLPLKVTSTKLSFNPSTGTETVDRITLANVDGANAVLWEMHDPTIHGTIGTAPGNVGGIKLGFTYQPVRFTNGPVGEVTYIDDTWHLGPNVGTASGGVGRIDTSKPNAAFTFESKFYSGSVFGQEVHLQGVTSDGLTQFRPMSFFLAHDASDIGCQFTLDRFLLTSKGGTPAMMQVSTANASVDWGTPAAPIKARFNYNNSAAIQQLNAAGLAFVDLLFLNSSNVAQIAAPLTVAANRVGQNFVTIQPTTSNSNDAAIAVDAPTLTGTFSGLKTSGSITGSLQTIIDNSAAAGGAHARGVYQTSGASGGDPYALFAVAGVTNWSIGVDNSDSDKFVMSAASSLGSNNVFVATTASPFLVGIGVGTPTAALHLKAGTATASTAPLKFNSGTSLTTAEAGAVEFTTDDFFATITTGAARKGIVLDDGARLTSGNVPVATTNGRLIDGPTLTSVVRVRASGRSVAQAAAVASVATYTLTAADASFRIGCNVNVTTSTLHSFSVQVDYTDETNTARTLTLTVSQLAGTFVTAITQVTGAGPYEGVPVDIRCKASTAITVKTTGTFTTVTYNVEGSIVQIA